MKFLIFIVIWGLLLIWIIYRRFKIIRWNLRKNFLLLIIHWVSLYLIWYLSILIFELCFIVLLFCHLKLYYFLLWCFLHHILLGMGRLYRGLYKFFMLWLGIKIILWQEYWFRINWAFWLLHKLMLSLDRNYILREKWLNYQIWLLYLGIRNKLRLIKGLWIYYFLNWR